MKDIISYALFGRGGMECALYWRPIPYLAIVNDLVYPSWVMRIHVHKSAADNPAMPFLERISRETPKVEWVPYEFDYTYDSKRHNTFPGIIRTHPVWLQDSRYVICRDIDSIPCTSEVRAVRVFVRKGFLVHGIRSHHAHTKPFMAGLCGFWAERLRENLPPFWESIYPLKLKAEQHDGFKCFSDQRVIQYLFANLHTNSMLDTPMMGAPSRVGSWPSTVLPDADYEAENIADINPLVLQLCDSMSKNRPGEKVGGYNLPFREAASLDTPMARMAREFMTKTPPWDRYFR